MRRNWFGPAVGGVVLVAILVVGSVVVGGSGLSAHLDNRDDVEYRVTVFGVDDERPGFRGTVDGERRRVEWPYRTDVRNLTVVGTGVERRSFTVGPNSNASVDLDLDLGATTVYVVETTDGTQRTVGVGISHCDGNAGEFGATIRDGNLDDQYWSC